MNRFIKEELSITQDQIYMWKENLLDIVINSKLNEEQEKTISTIIKSMEAWSFYMARHII